MNGTKFVLCCVIVWLPRHGSEALSSSPVDEIKRNGLSIFLAQLTESSNRRLQIGDALKFDHTKQKMIANFVPRENQENTVRSKQKHSEEKPTIFQRIGAFMIMIPVGMQLLQLPMSIASIKMSLIKSILVSKIALLLLFIRIIFMSNIQEKVIFVRTPPKEHHEHYYLPFEDPEDSKPGWLGKPPAWLA